MFMRKLGVAAALVLCALGASASNFRGADQVYVPVAGHAGGSSGLFISDAYIANLTGDVVDVSVLYIPRGPNAGGATPAGIEEIRNRITLQPFERREFPDIFVNTLGKESGFGLLIFNGCKAGASCGTDQQDSEGNSANYRAISVQTRIYQINPSAGQNPPTTGQLFSGIPWYHFVSKVQNTVGLDKVFITGLTQTGTAGQAGTYRSNIGVVNASEYSRTNIVFRLYQGGMSDANLKGTATVALGPLGSQLYGFNELFPGVTGSNYWVTVEQTGVERLPNAPGTCLEGCPAFLAYGSVLDNVSGDATTMEAQYMVELSQKVIDELYPPNSGKRTMRRAARH